MRENHVEKIAIPSQLLRLWGTDKVNPDETTAFIEWINAYNADDRQYQAYETEYFQNSAVTSPADDPVLQAQYLGDACGDDNDRTGCNGGGNTKTGTYVTASLPNTDYDGEHECNNDQTQTEPLQLRYGHSYLMADQGTSLPPSEDLSPAENSDGTSEPVLTAQFWTYEHKAWFVFPALGVPANAIINYAEIKLTTQNKTAGGRVATWIKAEKTTNASPPNKWFVTGWWTDKTWTSNWAEWIDDHEPVIDESYYTGNFACVIQELCQQQGWSTSSGALIVIDPQPRTEDGFSLRYIYDFSHAEAESVPERAASIHIWYSMPVNESGSGGVAGGGSATFVYNEVGSGGTLVGGSARTITPWFETEWYVADAIDNTGLSRAVYNIDNYLFLDIQLTAKANSSFAAGDHVDLYMICEKLDQNGSSYEEGDVTIGAPAANYLGSFLFGATSQTQTHILRMIPIPPLMFKLMLLNSAATIDEMTLTVRPYRYQTSEV